MLVGWVDTETDLNEWLDRPDEPELTLYLTAAYEQCLAYLPTKNSDGVVHTVVPIPLPRTYILAQIFQARALYRSALAGSGDTMGGSELGVTVYPMDLTVKNLLRPRRVGRMG